MDSDGDMEGVHFFLQMPRKCTRGCTEGVPKPKSVPLGKSSVPMARTMLSAALIPDLPSDCSWDRWWWRYGGRTPFLFFSFFKIPKPKSVPLGKLSVPMARIMLLAALILDLPSDCLQDG